MWLADKRRKSDAVDSQCQKPRKRAKKTVVKENRKSSQLRYNQDSILACIKKKRSEFDDSKLCLSELKKIVDNLKRKIETLTGRHQIREKLKIKNELDNLEKLVQDIEENQTRESFEKKANVYIQKYDITCTGNVNAAQIFNRNGGKCEAPHQVSKNLAEEFRAEIENENNQIETISREICPNCQVLLILISQEYRLGCPQCGLSKPYLESTSAAMAYGNEVEFAVYHYRRQVHLDDRLKAFQGKENKDIPKALYDFIIEQLLKRGIKDANQITQPVVRKILNESRKHKFYEHVPLITSQLSGIPAPQLTPEQENNIRRMFIAIQAPFERLQCDEKKRNHPPYHYFLYRAIQLLGYDELLPYCHLPKLDSNLQKNETLFNEIFNTLGWPIKRTVRF